MTTECGRLPLDRVFYFLADILKLGERDVFQTFSAVVEFFVNFDGGFLHEGMRIFAAADEEKIISACNSGLIVVVVEGQS